MVAAVDSIIKPALSAQPTGANDGSEGRQCDDKHISVSIDQVRSDCNKLADIGGGEPS